MTPSGRTGAAAAWHGPLRAALVPATTLSLLVLSFGSLPGVRFAQETPWTTAAGLALLPLVAVVGAWRPTTAVARAVWMFAGFAVAHSVIAVAIEAVAGGATPTRLLAWARQIAALGSGVALFAAMRAALPLVGTGRAARAISLASLPALALAGLNALAALAHWGDPFRVEKAIRQVFVPLGYTWWQRASGLSTEPSHLAFLVAAMTVPVTLALVRASRGAGRAGWIAMLAGQLGALAWTFSGTGYLVLGVALAAALLTPWRRLALWSVTGALGAMLLLVAVRPVNYVTLRLEYLAFSVSGDGGPVDETVGNTLAGAVGPPLRLGSSLVAVGYGLGGTSTHLEDVLPRAWTKSVRRVSWERMPNLRSLTGRILAETGLLGLGLFAWMIVAAWRGLAHGGLGGGTSLDREMVTAARVAMVAMLAGYVVKYGSFASPYLWIWLALADWPAATLPDRPSRTAGRA